MCAVPHFFGMKSEGLFFYASMFFENKIAQRIFYIPSAVG